METVMVGKVCLPLYEIISKRGRIPMTDLRDRPLVCVGVEAHYGHEVSMWAMSVQGTPPRGTILFDMNRYTPPMTLLVVQQDVYRIKGKEYAVVDRFVKDYLESH